MSDFAAPDPVPTASVDVRFPFSAVVGQQRLQLALLLCAVHPGIGGVLVRGEKGTAKSTVVRALAGLLPTVAAAEGARPARLVELPVGATEDRVVGSLDVELVLREGQRAFRPGLLARADQGILYVDEVNLLPDHLVDVLLDAAAMGRAHIERDGVSYSHPARFVLIGTMNPEEGELRPQLLDRFGLTVDVAASRDVEVRMAVVRQRLAFEADPVEFAARHAKSDAAIASRIVAARALVGEVVLDEAELRRIAALCAACEVDGMRADLVVARTATAHAAWRGAKAVAAEDVRAAAELALPHRRRRDPFDEPGISRQQLDEALRQAADEVERAGGDFSENSQQTHQSPADPETDPDDDPDGGPSGAVHSEGRTQAPAPLPGRPPKWEVSGVGEGAPGRRSRAQTRNGRVVQATRHRENGLHVLGTIFAAIPEQYSRGRRSGALRVLPRDARGVRREGREGNLVIFAVDTSGSMAARSRLQAVTGAVVTLLRDAYQRRDKVAVITLRGRDAVVAVPPTSSIDIAVRRMTGLPTGGKTPVAAGLLRVRDVVRRERLREPKRRALVVVLTDGRATGGDDPVGRARRAARLLSRDGVAAVVVDCEHGLVRLGLAADLARDLRGQCLTMAELTDTSLARIVQSEVRGMPRAA